MFNSYEGWMIGIILSLSLSIFRLISLMPPMLDASGRFESNREGFRIKFMAECAIAGCILAVLAAFLIMFTARYEQTVVGAIVNDNLWRLSSFVAFLINWFLISRNLTRLRTLSHLGERPASRKAMRYGFFWPMGAMTAVHSVNIFLNSSELYFFAVIIVPLEGYAQYFVTLRSRQRHSQAL